RGLPPAAEAAGPGAARAAHSAEQPLEDVPEVDVVAHAETLEIVRRRPVARAGVAEAAAAEASAEWHGRIAVGVDLAAVEARALVLVRQQVVGLGHLREALGGLRVVLVAVGMELLGQLAVGGLDVLLGRTA